MTRTPLAIAGLSSLGAALTWLRWLAQGSGNRYTDLSRQRYVPDPDLGWRLTAEGPIWLGLDLAVALSGLALAALLYAKLTRTGGPAWLGWTHSRPARAAATALALLSLFPATLAFASGLGPAGARDRLPADSDLISLPAEGVRGHIDAPAGRYLVSAQAGSRIAAQLRAGGESFEARFDGDLRGELRLDPKDLDQPLSARIEVAASSVDTGIDLRSKHAREDLQVERHPNVAFQLTRLRSAESRPDGTLAFSADGAVELMGRQVPVKVVGTLSRLDDDAAVRLGTSGPTLVVSAQLELDLAQTPLAGDDTFDSPLVPILVSLVLVHAPTPSQETST